MGRPTASRIAAAAVLVALVPGVRPAAADPSAVDAALAQALFDDARKLMEAKDYDRACPKFAQSEHLDPGGGTLLNLAICHEAQGKTATAWTEFNEALSRALRDGRQERVARARERIAALGPALSHLTVTLAPDAGVVELRVDGAAWGAELRGVPVPLDPGPHTVVASAPGATPWTAAILLGAQGDARLLIVPALGRSTAFEAGSRPGSSSGRATLGWILGGAGVVALGVGSYFGVRALSKRSDSNADCTPGCSQQGVDLNDDAVTSAWVSDFGIGLGLAGVAAGAYLLLTRGDAAQPTTAARSVMVVPGASSRGAKATVLVTF